jgi:sugar O-acyltransferase (sialic acid O-acetyltransferase NeuD family)
MIRDMAIYGAGGFGREVALMVQQINEEKKQWNVIGFFDDLKPAGSEIDGLRIIGTGRELNLWKTPLSVVMSFADPVSRKLAVSKIQNQSIGFPVIMHPACLHGTTLNKFQRGCILTAGCILTTGIELNEFVIINLNTTIGHDVKVGSFSSVMPSVNLSGNVIIDDGVFIGSGSTVLQGLTIGEGAVIGAGAVVTKNIPPQVVAKGVPARWRE